MTAVFGESVSNPEKTEAELNSKHSTDVNAEHFSDLVYTFQT